MLHAFFIFGPPPDSVPPMDGCAFTKTAGTRTYVYE